MKDIKLYTVTHKSIDYLPKGRTLIGVGGRELLGVDIYDSTLDNISDKNLNYCELTALYWLWKNDDSEYIGLEYYRRFFCGFSLLKANVLSLEKIDRILNKCDAIIPKQCKVKNNLYQYYSENHYGSDLDICKNIIMEKYPEYIIDYNTVMNGQKYSICNMFIMDKTKMDDYCSWLFDILFECEKRINLSNRDRYQQRVFGFLAERLFNVWLKHNKVKITYKRIYMLDDKPIINKLIYIKKIIFNKSN